MDAAIHLSRVGHSPDIRLGSHGAEVEIWGPVKYLSGLLRRYFVKDQYCHILQRGHYDHSRDGTYWLSLRFVLPPYQCIV